jgi:hypothetical protein
MQVRNIALLGDFVSKYAMFGIFNKSISTVRINCKNNNNKPFSQNNTTYNYPRKSSVIYTFGSEVLEKIH